MKTSNLKAALMAAAVSICLVPIVAPAQQPAPAAKAYKAPRLSNGLPDINGVWTNATITPLERSADYGNRLVMTPEELRKVEQAEAEYIAEGDKPTNPNFTIADLPVNCGRGFSGVNCGYNRGWTDPGSTVMRVNGEPRTSFITSTPNGRVPAPKAGAQAAGRGGGGAGAGRGGAAPAAGGAAAPARMGQFDNPEQRGLGERCIMSFGSSAGPVMLPLLYNNNYKIVQSKDSVGIWVEMVHDVRVIRIGDKHRTDGIRPLMGDSIGWYEGDTLVAETTNFPQRQGLRGAWEDLKVTERFTRRGPDRLLYQFKVEAPSMWDTAWGGEYEFKATKGEIYEYACHEGNYALEGILAGARNDEAVAARAAAGRPAGTQ